MLKIDAASPCFAPFVHLLALFCCEWILTVILTVRKKEKKQLM